MSIATSSSMLVERAEAILAQAQVVEARERAKDRKDPTKVRVEFVNQTSQLRNLVQIVQVETEVLVLQNFIQYQIGRTSTREFWFLIGDQVIECLKEIEKDSRTYEAAEEVRSKAVRNFFGYLVRHYVYVNEMRRLKAQREKAEHQPGASGRRMQ